MTIYTKTGDQGETSLAGGTRVKKNNVNIEAYGNIDELNSFIGMIKNFNIDKKDKDLIEFIQNKLFDIGAILAVEEKQIHIFLSKLNNITEKDTFILENAIDLYSENLPVLRNFIIPAGSELISWCNISRTVCRRAERSIIAIKTKCNAYTYIIIFINRLSDLLFIMGRKYAKEFNIDEILWNNSL